MARGLPRGRVTVRLGRSTVACHAVIDVARAVASHRQVAALVEAADRAGVAGDVLPAVRARLAAQRTRLSQAAARAGAPLPSLAPTPDDIASAALALGDLSPAAVGQAIRTTMATLDSIDAALVAPSTPGWAATAPSQEATTPGWEPTTSRWLRSPYARNTLIYGIYALFVVITEFWIFLLVDERRLPLLAPVCLLVLPTLAWLAGFATIGIAFRSPPGGPKVNYTPRLGAVICLVPLLLPCLLLAVDVVIS